MVTILQRFDPDDVLVTARLTPVLVRHGGLLGLAAGMDAGYQVGHVYGEAVLASTALWLCKRGHLLTPQFLAGPQGHLP